MLREFCAIRCALKEAALQPKSRLIKGSLTVTDDRIQLLTPLQADGYVENIYKDDKNSSHLPDLLGHVVVIVLNPRSLNYFENLQELISLTINEPDTYYVFSIGEITRGDNGNYNGADSIRSYRQMLRARDLLRATADFPSEGKAIFLTPEKIEIPLAYSESSIPALVHLENLQNQFKKNDSKDPADIDQRLVLFRKSLREYLKAHPPEDRFNLFLKNFETIYDSYNRDYQLWVGNTFGELEKSFEEKRLKFVADLNGILAGVQASLLAVPIAAILLGDKYDMANPLKDFLLAAGILAVAIIAFRLLQNQEATLDATREAIDATKVDFEKKHTKRREEFKTRLQSLDAQEQKVRSLLWFIRNTIILIVIAGFVGWLFALFQSTHPQESKAGISLPASINTIGQRSAP